MAHSDPRHPSHAWDGHLLLLYHSEDERLDALADWVREGLGGGEKVIYMDHPAPGRPSIAELLGGHGLDVGPAVARGQLAVLAPEEFYPPAGPEPAVQRALDEGYPAVRVTAAADLAHTMLTSADWLDAERRMDRLCRTRPVSGMCQYARDWLDDGRLREMVGVHVTGIRETQLSTGETAGGLSLGGEIDLTNGDVLAAAVDAATCDGTATVLRLDLGELTFADVAGCRALVEATRGFRENGGRVELVGARPLVARALRLLGYDETPGLELRDDPR